MWARSVQPFLMMNTLFIVTGGGRLVRAQRQAFFLRRACIYDYGLYIIYGYWLMTTTCFIYDMLLFTTTAI